MSDAEETAAGAGPLADRWAVVTGASKGIGFGIARGFVAAGANVMIVARTAEDLQEAGELLRKQAGDGQVVATARADTSDPASVDELFTAIAEQLPRLDIYVANAGSGVVTPFLEIPREEWDHTVALNLTGTFLGCQRAARLMVAGEYGRPGDDRAIHGDDRAIHGDDRAILVVSSIRSLGVRPGRLAYSVTKAGLNQLVRVAAYELAEHRIRVNALLPGITATPLALEGNPEIFAAASASVPLGRAGGPGDMASAAVYLCSPAARFVTGTQLVVDGGESLW
jgi:NAD(P)-dependent dehydrogenase (short-subunit alcohol dehydrogenase family)